MCDVSILEENGVEIPEDLKEQDELQANIWVCNGKLLRMVLNPFKPAKIPYGCTIRTKSIFVLVWV